MFALVARRLGQLIPVLLVASICVWGMIQLLPGDAATATAGPYATTAGIEQLRKEMGLDQPAPVQYAKWLWRAVRGDFGRSALNGYPIVTLLAQRIPATIQLTGLALLSALLVATPLGIAAATRPQSWLARATNVYCSLSLSIPSFWVGLIFILLFSLRLHLLPPLSQYVPIASQPLESLRNMIGPAAVLALLVSGIVTRFVRSALVEVLSAEYLRTAKSKGLSRRQILLRHAMRNASIPVITVVGLHLGSVLGGVVLIEAVFNYPGMGLLALTAVQQRDFPLIQGIMLFSVTAFVLVNLVVDVIYAIVDPRIRHENQA